MIFTDMDMLQDYEKDTRMATIAYTLMQTDIIDPTLKNLFGTLRDKSAKSQEQAANLILSRGDRP